MNSLSILSIEKQVLDLMKQKDFYDSVIEKRIDWNSFTDKENVIKSLNSWL